MTTWEEPQMLLTDDDGSHTEGCQCDECIDCLIDQLNEDRA